MQNTNPLVTIITITYNAAEFLEETIKSIIYQDYTNIEYLIIDGKSKDTTLDIINKYNNSISSWISEPDEGIYDAMNKGIEKATGEWILFMHAGDIFYSHSTISNVFKLLENSTDVICGDTYYYNNSKELVLKKYGGADSLYDGGFNFACHQSVFSKTKILKDNPFSKEYKIVSDYEFLLKTYKKGFIFQFIDIPVSIYLNGGFSKQNRIKARIEELYLISKFIDEPTQILKKAPFKRLLSYDEENSNSYYFNKKYSDFLENLYLVTKNKKFILYGYGNIGKLISLLFKENILFIVDNNYKYIKEKEPDLNIYSPSKIKTNLDTNILISVLGRENEIKHYLKTFNIQEKYILSITI